MIKRVGFNHFPNKGSNISKQGNNFSKQYNNYQKQMSNPSKPPNKLPKPSTGLSKSTKTLLITVIAIIVIIVLFFIIRGIINGNKDETPVDKLNADLKISEVQVLNYTDLIFNVDGDVDNENIDSINLIIYNENDSVILRKKILINDLEENDFYINIHVTNTSKIKDITVTPTFVNEEGKKVVGEVEDEYTLTDEEKYNYNGEDKLPEEETPTCILDYECDDSNSCTTDNCVEGECSHTDVSECIPCKSSSECEDSITCTTNTCSNGKCSYLAIPGCVSCASVLDCDDSNSCTENICSGGRCLYTPMESCVSCSLDSECEDNDICTENICSNGACLFSATSGCKSCSLNSGCNDNDLSTKDSCLNNKCEYVKITSCINNDKYCPSGCTITNDNDCVYIPICGNGIREGDEKCDLSAFGGATCAGALGTGYTGTLKCTKICTFNTSLCAPPCTCSNDNNICTADGCVNNVCQHVPLTGNSCVSDNNVCTNDVCSSKGVCTHNAIPGCCLSNAQCTGGKICTSNVCVNSVTSPNPTSSCLNRIKDGSETGIDCGGDCDSCSVSGKTYYIATNGSNNNPGTFEKPWKTWDYGFNHISAGDVLYIREGIYSGVDYMHPVEDNNRYGIYVLDRSGTSSKHIVVRNYPGETPILDGSAWKVTTGSNIGIRMDNCNYWDIRGLTVTKFLQYSDNSYNSPGWFIDNCSNIVFENCVTHDCGDGFTMWEGMDYLRFINCDSYQNHDRYIGDGSEEPGGLANGFYGAIREGDHVFFKGCRSWSNSDDGWDLYKGAGYVVWENCWAFNNGDGYGGVVGDGSGFKMGPVSVDETGDQRLLYNCLAVNNQGLTGIGFDQNMGLPIPIKIYNSFAYKNDQNFQFWGISGSLIRNSISLSGVDEFRTNTVDHNSWQNGLSASSGDFVSLDISQLSEPRKSDGSLPDITFGHLVADSDLINAGVVIPGRTSDGYGNSIIGAPDIGAFEYSSAPICTATTCSAQGKNCGSISNGCGEILNCGSCSGTQSCVNNLCTALSSSNPLPSSLRKFYVNATTGDDNNAGTSPSAPWKTLNKVNSQTFRAGDAILFKRGDTWYGTLSISSSGSSSNPITFSAYGIGNKPLITGWTTITGWTNEDNGVYSKVVSTESALNMVSVNGVNTAMGRTPNIGEWWIYESTSPGYIVDNQLSGYPDWTGADVVIKTQGYIIDRSSITSHSGNTIYYDNSMTVGGNQQKNWGYFIQDDVRTLDKLGEWYYDENDNKFYMYFGSVVPTTKDVKVASLDKGIKSSQSYITFDNINIQGFNGAGLDLSNSNNIKVTNCEVGFTGSNGIILGTNNLYDNLYFHDINADGFSGSEDGFTLTNSRIENIGMIEGSGYGYGGRGSAMDYWGSNALIQYNTFRNIGLVCVGQIGNDVTIDSNFFDNCCNKSFDCGAIYMNNNGGNKNRVVSNNIIINTIGTAAGTHDSNSYIDNMWSTVEGIYLDEPCSGVIVEGNSVYNIRGSGIKLHEANNIIIRENTIYNAFEGFQFFGSGAQPNDPIKNVDMDNNIIVAKRAEQYLWVFLSLEGLVSQFGTANGNYYSRPYWDGTWGAIGPEGTNLNVDFWGSPNTQEDDKHTFAQWKTLTGQDKDSHYSRGIVSSPNDILFEYNAAKTNKVIALSGNYKDVKGVSYSGSVTLKPYTSIVLIKS